MSDTPTTPPDAKPTISEKEVSWHEAVAMHAARKEALAGKAQEQANLLEILKLPSISRHNVAGMELEPYSLAISLTLESLRHPWEIGGTPTNADLIVGWLVFSRRDFVEGLIDTYGAERARQILYGAEAQRSLGVQIDATQLKAFTTFIRTQLGLVDSAAGAAPGK